MRTNPIDACALLYLANHPALEEVQSTYMHKRGAPEPAKKYIRWVEKREIKERGKSGKNRKNKAKNSKKRAKIEKTQKFLAKYRYI